MPALAPSSSGLDNTSIDELHNLGPHRRVLHVVLQRLGTALRLLQNTLHNRIGHDFLSSQQTVSTTVPAINTTKHIDAPQFQGPASRAPTFPAQSHSHVAH